MSISKELIQQYAQKCNITIKYATELIEESILQQKFISRHEAEKVVSQCLEIIIRTIK